MVNPGTEVGNNVLRIRLIGSLPPPLGGVTVLFYYFVKSLEDMKSVQTIVKIPLRQSVSLRSHGGLLRYCECTESHSRILMYSPFTCRPSSSSSGSLMLCDSKVSWESFLDQEVRRDRLHKIRVFPPCPLCLGGESLRCLFGGITGTGSVGPISRLGKMLLVS